MRWLRSWLSLWSLRGGQRRVVRSIRRMERTGELLSRDRGRLRTFDRRLALLSETIAEDLEESERAQKKSEEAVEALRGELEIYRDVTIPTLTAAHALLLARYDAETAVVVRNQVAAQAAERQIG